MRLRHARDEPGKNSGAGFRGQPDRHGPIFFGNAVGRNRHFVIRHLCAYLLLLCHISNRLGASLKLLFPIGGIDRGLAFLVADLHLSDHLLNTNVASRQEVG
jgi:hypothetical protein